MKLEDVLKMTRFESPQHKAVLNVMYTAYWYKAKTNGLLKEFGLTTEQFNVLRILKGKHPEAMCVKDIGSRMIEENSNVPRIVDRLILKGLAARTQSAEDRRETLVSLTEKGLSDLAIVNKALKKFSETLVQLTDEEALALNNTLDHLRQTTD